MQVELKHQGKVQAPTGYQLDQRSDTHALIHFMMDSSRSNIAKTQVVDGIPEIHLRAGDNTTNLLENEEGNTIVAFPQLAGYKFWFVSINRSNARAALVVQ